MKSTLGYFWMRLGPPVSVNGGASTAKIASKPGKVQGGGVVKGLQYIEGGTIRIDAKMSMGQTVASFTVLDFADLTKVNAASLSFYADSPDPDDPAQSFESPESARAEIGKPVYTNWAKGGVVVLVSIKIQQS